VAGLPLWIGDRWIDETGREGLLRITLVDPHLGIVEAQSESQGFTTSATIEAFVTTHRPLGRSELSAEHGW
jgi:hypothetical protein